MEIKDYLIGLVLFGVVVTTFWYAYVDVGTNYGVTPDAEYVNTYSNISSTMETTRGDVRDIRDDIRSKEADSEDQYGGSLITGAFNSLRLIWNSFTSVNLIAEQVQEKLGIPDYFVLALISIIIIAISFAIISAVFKANL